MRHVHVNGEWVWFLNDLVTIEVSQDGDTRAYSHSSVECLRELLEKETQSKRNSRAHCPLFLRDFFGEISTFT